MEEDYTDRALVPSKQRVIFTQSHRLSLPNVPDNFSLSYGEAVSGGETVTISHSPDTSGFRKPRYTWEALSAITSILYGYLIVVLGLALPVTQMITKTIPTEIFDTFYIYLYGGSLAFIISLKLLSLKKKAVKRLTRSSKEFTFNSPPEGDKYPEKNHGSFYLRLGASAFGIGSMVYSGLEFGEHFLFDEGCERSVVSAIKPALRMLFTLLQIGFIFLNEHHLERSRCPSLLRISLSHMLATNLAEWLAVVIEETKHEIHHLYPAGNHHELRNGTNFSHCDGSSNGVLVRGATSFLFPCAIEYSLICAVTLVEMWKDIRIDKTIKRIDEPVKEIHAKKDSKQHYSVDCTHSNKGLSAGLISVVYTLISLIVFFSLRTSHQESAYLCLTYCEIILYTSSLVAMGIATYEMRNLAYCVHRIDDRGSLNLGLDISLLLKAQIGAYMYHIFSVIACVFTPETSALPDLYAILQTSLQTSFILDTWWKRCATPMEQEKKPGRQCLTFLRIVNFAMWLITITEKNRAELKPLQLAFYGMWPWTIITHISMPLNVFYRFHSSICFFEVWRNSYKGIHERPDSDLLF